MTTPRTYDAEIGSLATDWFGMDDPPAAPIVVHRRSVGVFSPKTWAELVYAVVDLAPTIVFFVLTVTLLSVGVGTAVIWVGVPLMALGLVVARAGGHLQRMLAGVLLDLPVQAPDRIRFGRSGPVGAIRSVLADRACWQVAGYYCLKILLAPVTFTCAIGFYATGLGGLTYGLWQHYLPYQSATDGSRHRGMQWWPDYFVDTWPRILVLAGLGALLLAAAPSVVRFFTTIDRMLISRLLGPVRP
jgi:hypothetical protein